MREILFRGKSTGNGEWVYGEMTDEWNDVCISQREELIELINAQRIDMIELMNKQRVDFINNSTTEEE